MSDERFDRGPLQTYELIYTSGHVERIQAHQVVMPQTELPDVFGIQVRTRHEARWTFHGEFDGRWTLVLSVPESDVKSVRNVSLTADDLGGAK
jgi:hypothetical protein